MGNPYVFLVSMEQRLDADELFGPEDSDDDVLVEEDPGHQNEAEHVGFNGGYAEHVGM